MKFWTMICVSSCFSCPGLSFRNKKMWFLWSFGALDFNDGYWECLQIKKEIPNSPHSSFYSRSPRIWATTRYGRAWHLTTHVTWPRIRVRHRHASTTHMHHSSSRIGHHHAWATFIHCPPIKHWPRTRISTPSRTRMRVRHQLLRSTSSNFKLP